MHLSVRAVIGTKFGDPRAVSLHNATSMAPSRAGKKLLPTVDADRLFGTGRVGDSEVLFSSLRDLLQLTVA